MYLYIYYNYLINFNKSHYYKLYLINRTNILFNNIKLKVKKQ